MGKAFPVAVVQQLGDLHNGEVVSPVVFRLRKDHKRLDQGFHRFLAQLLSRRNVDAADGGVQLVQLHHSVNLVYTNLQNTNSFFLLLNLYSHYQILYSLALVKIFLYIIFLSLALTQTLSFHFYF